MWPNPAGRSPAHRGRTLQSFLVNRVRISGGGRTGAIKEINCLQLFFREAVIQVPPTCKMCSDPFQDPQVFFRFGLKRKAADINHVSSLSKTPGPSPRHLEKYTTPFQSDLNLLSNIDPCLCSASSPRRPVSSLPLWLTTPSTSCSCCVHASLQLSLLPLLP